MGHKEDALPFMGENSDSLALSQREVFESSFDLSGGRPRSEVRGQGLLVGVHCTESIGELVVAARERGLLVIPAGEGDVLRMVPPLVVSEAEVDEAASILQECFRGWQ